jgi:hypothetical protein
MKKEFDLSKRITDEGKVLGVINIEDVKEFIRLLKEGIHGFNEMETGDIARNDFIDKLAGKELIK